MRSTSRVVRTAVMAALIAMIAAFAAAAPANADGHGRDDPCKRQQNHCKFKAKSNLRATPHDAGGRNAQARITGFRGGGAYAVDFQSYDEIVYLRDSNPDSHNAVVHIKYYGPGGPYKYRYTTGSSRTIQLGSDNDLTENYRIKMKLCIAQHKCTRWAKGWT